jgi:hypothetical protein
MVDLWRTMMRIITAIALLCHAGVAGGATEAENVAALALKSDVVVVGTVGKYPLGFASSMYIEWVFDLHIRERLHGSPPGVQTIRVTAIQPRETDALGKLPFGPSQEFLLFLKRPAARPGVWVTEAYVPCLDTKRVAAIREQLKAVGGRQFMHPVPARRDWDWYDLDPKLLNRVKDAG